MRFWQRTRGFSLLEMLAVVAIAAFILVFAVPSYTKLMVREECELTRAELMRALEYARAEALLRHIAVAVCASNDQQQCSLAGARGLLVFSGAQLLHVFQFSQQAGELHWRGFQHNRNLVEFLPTGMTNDENGSYWYCARDASVSVWVVAVGKSGRVREVVGGGLKCWGEEVLSSPTFYSPLSPLHPSRIQH